jgi:hypothetical protein
MDYATEICEAKPGDCIVEILAIAGLVVVMHEHIEVADFGISK